MFASTLRVAGRAGVRGLAGLPKYDEASNISMKQLMPAIAVLAGDVCNTLDSWQYLTLFDHLIHKVLESICLLLVYLRFWVSMCTNFLFAHLFDEKDPFQKIHRKKILLYHTVVYENLLASVDGQSFLISCVEKIRAIVRPCSWCSRKSCHTHSCPITICKKVHFRRN